MALQKNYKTSSGVVGNYLRIMRGLYIADIQRFHVEVGIYLNQAHRDEPDSKPLELISGSLDCAYAPGNPVSSAYTELKTGFPLFAGAEDC